MRFYDPSTNPPERLDSSELFPDKTESDGAKMCLKLGLLPSVTTVLNTVREDYLERWFCRSCIELDRALGSKKPPKEVVEKFFNTPSENAQFGTDVHDLISNWVLHGKRGDPKTLEWRHALPLVQYLEENMDEVVLSEEIIACKELGVAGAIDLVYRNKNGDLVLGDMKVVKWSSKFPKKPGFSYRAQLSGYAEMLRLERGMNVIRMSLYLSSPFGWEKNPKLIRYEHTADYLKAFKASRTIWESRLMSDNDDLLINGSTGIAMPMMPR